MNWNSLVGAGCSRTREEVLDELGAVCTEVEELAVFAAGLVIKGDSGLPPSFSAVLYAF